MKRKVLLILLLLSTLDIYAEYIARGSIIRIEIDLKPGITDSDNNIYRIPRLTFELLPTYSDSGEVLFRKIKCGTWQIVSSTHIMLTIDPSLNESLKDLLRYVKAIDPRYKWLRFDIYPQHINSPTVQFARSTPNGSTQSLADGSHQWTGSFSVLKNGISSSSTIKTDTGFQTQLHDFEIDQNNISLNLEDIAFYLNGSFNITEYDRLGSENPNSATITIRSSKLNNRYLKLIVEDFDPDVRAFENYKYTIESIKFQRQTPLFDIVVLSLDNNFRKKYRINFLDFLNFESNNNYDGETVNNRGEKYFIRMNPVDFQIYHTELSKNTTLKIKSECGQCYLITENPKYYTGDRNKYIFFENNGTIFYLYKFHNPALLVLSPILYKRSPMHPNLSISINDITDYLLIQDGKVNLNIKLDGKTESLSLPITLGKDNIINLGVCRSSTPSKFNLF